MKERAIPIPDEPARKMRILAAGADASISQCLCWLVEERVSVKDECRDAMERLGAGQMEVSIPARFSSSRQ